MHDEVTVSLDDYSVLHLITRVLTAATPTNLNLVAPPHGSHIFIYASILDQPITVSSSGSAPIPLARGPGTGNIGVTLFIMPNEPPRVTYRTTYSATEDSDLRASPKTQQRIALAVFWTDPSIAISPCAFVAAPTATPPLYAVLNAQAVALGQQLAVQAMTGPDTSYVPGLKMDWYRGTAKDTLDALGAFEAQYARFLDQGAAADARVDAWRVMLAHAKAQRAKLVVLSAAGWEKDRDAAGFSVNIGMLCMGDADGIAGAIVAVGDAVEAARDAETVPDQTGVKISSSTLQALADSMGALETLYPSLDDLVSAVHNLATNPNADLPSKADISGSAQGDADANAILALGSWDKHNLESDAQLEWGVSREINGAVKYRLALQKHGINGKTLAQAQAEAIKAGNEYVQSELQARASDEDVANLEEMLETYEGQADVYARAAAIFYDRAWDLRTTLMLEMRKMVWAYKYWALQDSRIVLTPQKPVEAFLADLALLDYEIETVLVSYGSGSDFQPFEQTVRSEHLPSDYGPELIKGLQGESHSASFTLTPSVDPASSSPTTFASISTNGAHFRIDGLSPILRGAKSRREALQAQAQAQAQARLVPVDMRISTSGIYADIRSGRVFNSASRPRTVRLSYDLLEDGPRGATHIHSSFPAVDHARETPFTQWRIELLSPHLLDLGGLVGVDLEWAGRAHFY
ncbi:uncharacterized protein DSM5745_01545 [Aspergillus mulundensis]|uniref:Uncharacterized protein n=1 Tax=Aspergillus mulundensis TaxID=1810919 RepID=A0A3D8T6P5_9EURO|nr:hypothetical protein DSM5745_01545 [Aspergillus mulundensis]RDW94223.1 hypothetical protein DSM5745_01545 [Aspergillus mulundensis]